MISSIGRAFALHANGFVFKSRIILFQTNKVCSETEDFEPFLEIPTELEYFVFRSDIFDIQLECYAFRSDTFPLWGTAVRSHTLGALTTGALVFNFRGVAEPSFGRTRFDRRRIQSLGSQRRAPASNTPCSVALPKRSFLSKKHIFYNQINIVYSEYLKIPLEFRSAPLVSIACAAGGTKGMRSNRRTPKGEPKVFNLINYYLFLNK